MYYENDAGDYFRDVVPYTQEANKIENVIVERNLTGRAYEKESRIEEAIALYEQNVKDFADTPHPYERLRIIYTKQKNYDDAIRVCQAYINMSNELALAIFKEYNDKKLAKQLGEKGKFPEFIKKLKQLKKASKS